LDTRTGPTSFIRKLFGHPSSALGTSIVGLFLLLAILGPLLAPYDANEQIVADTHQSPSSKHLFGTDNLGRDVFSRVILGARDILLLAGLGTAFSVMIGTTIGLLSGYFGKWLDEIIMRVFDSLMAIPALLLALLILGTFGPSRNGVLMVLVVIYTPIVARVVRSVVLDVKTKAFVDVARIQGESLPWILFREILPSTLPALTVEASMRFSYSIFLVSSLGFLGIGVQPPNPDWGLMVKEARTFVSQTPWALYFPASAIAIVVIGVNLMADSLKRIVGEAES
jgi:peptide/nickel transport system permease protein